MNMNKLDFLKNELPSLFRKLEPQVKGNWGVMNAQQMVEHMADSISQATGRNHQTIHTPAEKLEAFKSFAMSDKEFKPNTKNALMAEVPAPVSLPGMNEAIQSLENEISRFIDYFEKNKGTTLTNPFFGDLNFEEWTHLFHKHAVHHCKQFNLL
jgi:hypothetical protein